MTTSATTGTPAPPPSAARRIRLLYIVSSPVPCATYGWIAGGLDRERFDLSFLLPNLGPATMEPFIRAQNVPTEHIPLEGRWGVLRAMRRIARYCRDEAVDVAHVHMERALLPGLLGAKLGGVPTRIYTRHIAGPYPPSYRRRTDALRDRRNNWLATHIVAPSETTRRTLERTDGVPPAKITVIPHGFPLDTFVGTESDAIRMRTKCGIDPADSPIVGVVSRFLDIKGIVYIIEAFRRLLATHPRARLVLANARGAQEREVRQKLQEAIPGRFTEIVYETDMAAVYAMFDVFVHVPVAPHLEAFGQVYVEALAAGIPSVFTLAGAAGDFVVDGENALVVPYRDADAIHRALLRLLGDPGLRARLSANGRRDVEARYRLDGMLRSLEDLYLQLHHAHARGGPPR